jgi:sodium-dependent dicarboxylate transporter 2/3/5
MEHAPAMTAAVTILCAVWWCTEAVPIPVTSIIPFAVFPLAGVLDHTVLAGAMGDKFVLLFMGGFMLSKAAEKSKAHLRVAQGMIKLVGTSSNRRIIIGFMLATAFCSMWISNTATALIMLPVAIAVIERNGNDKRFAVSLLLAIAYGSSIGGMSTLIGTPPNGVFAGIYEKTTHIPVDFVSWLKIGIPVSVLMLIACGIVLTFFVKGGGNYTQQALGPWTPAQRRVTVVLGLTALLWITRKLPFDPASGIGYYMGEWAKGWAGKFNMPMAQDATVALLMVVVMFLIPNGLKDDKGKRDHLLDWKTARDIPWGILLLFAGGIAIAKAFGSSGLAAVIGQQMEQLTSGMSPLMIIAIICLTVTFMTEVTSNTATTTLLMPILAASAVAAGVEPSMLMIPAALSASCAFMLPVATPPNAIVFGGSDHITIPQMVRHGFVLNIIGVIVVTAVCYFVLDPQKGLGIEAPDATPAAQVESVGK